MMHTRSLLLIMLAGILGAGACSPADQAPPRLPGQWSGRDAMGTRQQLVFEPDSTVLWIFERPAGPDTFRLRYRIDYQSAPHPIVLRGFDRGFLEGRALFGILEFVSADTFRVDFEPGPPDAAAADIRPDTFTEDAVTYHRSH